MRLEETQQAAIREIIQREMGQVDVRLFGSRVRDELTGGDVDLMVESHADIENPALLAARLAARLSRVLGGRKVDVLLAAPNLKTLPIHQIAHNEGVLL